MQITLVGAASARAWELNPTRWDVPRYGVPFCAEINSKDAVDAATRQAFFEAVQAAVETWSAPCSNWCASVVPCATTPTWQNPNDGMNSISWIGGNWPAGSTTLAVTLSYTVAGSNTRVDADTLLNDVTFSWQVGSAGASPDVQSVVLHEMGHALGMDHYDALDPNKHAVCNDSNLPIPAVMCADYRGGLIRTLTQDDNDGLCAKYPVVAAPACAMAAVVTYAPAAGGTSTGGSGPAQQSLLPLTVTPRADGCMEVAASSPLGFLVALGLYTLSTALRQRR